MAVLQSLLAEHVLISNVLDALDVYADGLEHSGRTNLDDARAFAAFFGEFCDLWHHAKEEEFVLPAMVRHGFDWDEGALARARQDHQQQAYLSRAFLQLANRKPTGDEREHRRELLSVIRALCSLQRRHMLAEEEEIFSRAGQLLPAEELESIERSCHELEAHRFGATGYDDFRELANDLVVRYAPSDRRPMSNAVG